LSEMPIVKCIVVLSTKTVIAVYQTKLVHGNYFHIGKVGTAHTTTCAGRKGPRTEEFMKM
jgi:hypothetical protein